MGTSYIKACLFEVNDEGPALEIATHAVPTPQLDMPAPGRVEQDPDATVAATIAALAGCLRDAHNALDEEPEIAAVGFSAAMHSLLPLDDKGQPLCHAITWADQRAAAQAEQLRDSGKAESVAFRTGTPVHPMSFLTKLLWLKAEQPALFERARLFTGLKEYVIGRLVDNLESKPVMDLSMATGTGLYNLTAGAWDDALMSTLGMAASRLPTVVPTTEQLPGLSAAVAGQTGLGTGVPLIIGAGDGPLANLGTGAVSPGVAAISVGTSGALRACTEGPLPDPQGRTFSYHLAGPWWISGGAISNGTLVLDWLRNSLHLRADGSQTMSALLEEAAALPAGSEGLLMLPYLTGERAPHWDPYARGVYFGLQLHHRAAHFVRAAMEGVAFALRDVLESLPSQLALREIRVTGGFTRNPLWVQIAADVLGRPLTVVDTAEAGAFGAALVAGLGAGLLGSPRDLASLTERLVRVSDRIEPGAAARGVYAAQYGMYAALYQSLANHFRTHGQG